jgi:hypothetical protein
MLLSTFEHCLSFKESFILELRCSFQVQKRVCNSTANALTPKRSVLLSVHDRLKRVAAGRPLFKETIAHLTKTCTLLGARFAFHFDVCTYTCERGCKHVSWCLKSACQSVYGLRQVPSTKKESITRAVLPGLTRTNLTQETSLYILSHGGASECLAEDGHGPA